MRDLNPCKLRELSDESRTAVIALLESIYKQHEQFLEETDNAVNAMFAEAGEYTAIGLEIVLEALGAEG